MLKTYDLGWYGLNDATQSDTTTFSDMSQFGGRRDDPVPVGADVRWRQATVAGGSTFNYGEARVSIPPTYAAGKITFNPSVATGGTVETPVVANNDTEILVARQGLRWQDAVNFMNAAITELGWEKRIVPLTLVDDGDLLLSAQTYWTDTGLVSSKTAATFSFPRYMQLVGSGSSEYVQSVTINVKQSDSYYLEIAACKIGSSSGDGVLSLQDITNSDTITLATTAIDERVPIILANSVSMAATTERVAVRIAKANGANNHLAVFYVILRKDDQRHFVIQDRPAKLLWLGQVRGVVGGTWADRSWTAMTPIAAKAEQMDAGVWEYHLASSQPGVSLWYEEFVQPAVMTADSSTTAIEMEDIAAVTAELWLRPLADKPDWKMRYQKALAKAVDVRMRRNAALQSLRQTERFIMSPARI